jgi:hypothetical protein
MSSAQEVLEGEQAGHEEQRERSLGNQELDALSNGAVAGGGEAVRAEPLLPLHGLDFADNQVNVLVGADLGATFPSHGCSRWGNFGGSGHQPNTEVDVNFGGYGNGADTSVYTNFGAYGNGADTSGYTNFGGYGNGADTSENINNGVHGNGTLSTGEDSEWNHPEAAVDGSGVGLFAVSANDAPETEGDPFVAPSIPSVLAQDEEEVTLSASAPIDGWRGRLNNGFDSMRDKAASKLESAKQRAIENKTVQAAQAKLGESIHLVSENKTIQAAHAKLVDARERAMEDVERLQLKLEEAKEVAKVKAAEVPNIEELHGKFDEVKEKAANMPAAGTMQKKLVLAKGMVEEFPNVDDLQMKLDEAKRKVSELPAVGTVQLKLAEAKANEAEMPAVNTVQSKLAEAKAKAAESPAVKGLHGKLKQAKDKVHEMPAYGTLQSKVGEAKQFGSEAKELVVDLPSSVEKLHQVGEGGFSSAVQKVGENLEGITKESLKAKFQDSRLASSKYLFEGKEHMQTGLRDVKAGGLSGCIVRMRGWFIVLKGHGRRTRRRLRRWWVDIEDYIEPYMPELRRNYPFFFRTIPDLFMFIKHYVLETFQTLWHHSTLLTLWQFFFSIVDSLRFFTRPEKEQRERLLGNDEGNTLLEAALERQRNRVGFAFFKGDFI